MRYSEAPETGDPEVHSGYGLPEGSQNKIMHCAFTVGDSMVMASDGMCSGKTSFAGLGLSLTASDEQGAEKLFSALSNGGQVTMPMTQTFFAKRFGMVQDKFGVVWLALGGPTNP